MLTCKQQVAVSSDYLDGQLSFRQRLLVRHHLLFCPNCRRFIRQMRLYSGKHWFTVFSWWIYRATVSTQAKLHASPNTLIRVYALNFSNALMAKIICLIVRSFISLSILPPRQRYHIPL